MASSRSCIISEAEGVEMRVVGEAASSEEEVDAGVVMDVAVDEAEVMGSDEAEVEVEAMASVAIVVGVEARHELSEH